MTTSDISDLASDQLCQTYFCLGLSSPGSRIIHETGFDACLGNFDHPICNFAARIELDPWVANRLMEIAIERRSFNVYSTAGDSPGDRDVRDEIMTRAGFKLGYRLQQMFWEPKEASETFEMEKATAPDARRAVSVFMATQFFPRHSATFRRRVSEATQAASQLDLYATYIRNEPIAAVMIAENSSVIGLFNLCVRPKNQGRGLGQAIVSEIKRSAYETQRVISLQCEDSMATWYERQGFVRSGWVDVYSLLDDRRMAIMN